MAAKNPRNEHEAVLKKVRTRLESLFRSFTTIQSVLIVAGETLAESSTDYSSEVAMVLMRCASDPMHEEMKELNSIIEGLGGKTTYSDEDEDDE